MSASHPIAPPSHAAHVRAGEWLPLGTASIARILLLVSFFVLAGSYAVATPPWNNPDEPAHFNYVRHVAETGTLPELRPGDWDGPLLERQKATMFKAGESIDPIRYESWQPPLYYLLATPLYLLLPDLPSRLLGLRVLGIVLGAMTLIVAQFIGREVFRDRRLEISVPLLLVGVPMFTAMSAAVSNDPLANLVAAGLTLACLRAVSRFPSRGTATGLGVLLAIGLWTKLSLAVFAPIVVASVVLGGWRTASLRQGLRAVAIAVGVTFVLYAPWLVRQGLTYGWNDLFASHRHDQVVLDQPRFPGFTADHLGYLAQTTFHSFWAQFGWMGLPVEDRLYWIWGILSVLAAVGLTRFMLTWRFDRGRSISSSPTEHDALSNRHSSDSAPSTQPSTPRVERVAVLGLVVCGYLAALAYYNLTFIQAQGRYLFPALPAIAALAILGWTYLLPRGLGSLGALGIGVGLVALNGYTFLRFVLPAFAR